MGSARIQALLLGAAATVAVALWLATVVVMGSMLLISRIFF